METYSSNNRKEFVKSFRKKNIDLVSGAVPSVHRMLRVLLLLLLLLLLCQEFPPLRPHYLCVSMCTYKYLWVLMGT